MQPSYIKDTYDFLDKIQHITISDHSILATIDVTSLYTSIPHKEGTLAIRSILMENNHTYPPVDTITKLVNLILKNNVFSFGSNFYCQIQGTAMGTRMAPSYANLFMATIEKQFLSDQILKPEIWLRFIDDVFLIWNHSEQDYLEFFENLNNLNNYLKYTEDHSTKEINFLDVTIYKKGKKLESKLYNKPTNAHLYLNYNSCHPRHNKQSIPFSQFTRLKRIHSEKEEYERSATKLEQYLKNRDYPMKLIKNCRKKAEENPQPRPPKNKTLIFVTSYNPRIPNIKPILEKFRPVLAQDPRTNYLAELPITIAFRRPRNLKNILVKSKLNTNNRLSPLRGSKPCQRPKCRSCALMKNTRNFKSSYTNECFEIKGFFNCMSQNVIYLIECVKCFKQYVGQTCTTVSTRMNAHRYDIKHKLDKMVPNHFNSPNHSYLDLRVTVIEQASANVLERQLRESIWIKKLQTLDPIGLNSQE